MPPRIPKIFHIPKKWDNTIDATWKVFLPNLQNFTVVIQKNGNIERHFRSRHARYKNNFLNKRVKTDFLSNKAYIPMFTKLANELLNTKYTTLKK